MFTAFEKQLANALAEDLPSPLNQRIHHPGQAPPPGNGGRIRCAIAGIDALPRDMGQRMPLVTISANLPTSAHASLRGVHLSVSLKLHVEPGQQPDSTLLEILAPVIYLLDSPTYRQGQPFDGRVDNRGFYVQSLALQGTEIRTEPSDKAVVSLTAIGWFWPIAEPAQVGIPIRDIHIREQTGPVS